MAFDPSHHLSESGITVLSMSLLQSAMDGVLRSSVQLVGGLEMPIVVAAVSVFISLLLLFPTLRLRHAVQVEFELVGLQLKYITETGGTFYLWPAVQVEIWLLLRLEGVRRREMLLLGKDRCATRDPFDACPTQRCPALSDHPPTCPRHHAP